MANLISVRSLPTLTTGEMDSKSIASSLGSFSDFQSQTELCPRSIKKYNKDKDLEKEGSNDLNGKDKNKTGIRQYGGILLALVASLCFSLSVLCVKILKDYGFDAYGASFWRYTGVTIPIIPVLMYYECGPGKSIEKNEKGEMKSVFDTVWPVFENDNWKTWIGLLSRGLIGSTSVILRFYALQYLTIGDTAVITYSTPVLVTIMAHFFLGEKCGVVPVIIAFTTLIGVVIVTRPPLLTGGDTFDSDTLIGTSLAVGSLFCSSLIVIITRKIREVNFALMTLVFGVIGVVQAAILCQSFGTLKVPLGLNDSLLTIALAVLSFIGQMTIILALKFEQAGPVALIRSCDVIFGFIFQFVFLGVVPDEFSSIGAIIVLFGVLITACRKWLNMLPDESKSRQRWSCLLR